MEKECLNYSKYFSTWYQSLTCIWRVKYYEFLNILLTELISHLFLKHRKWKIVVYAKKKGTSCVWTAEWKVDLKS
jgi:hypothetical protein